MSAARTAPLLTALTLLAVASSGESETDRDRSGTDPATTVTTQGGEEAASDLIVRESETYTDLSHWLCHPDLEDDVCHEDLSATVVEADGTTTVEAHTPAEDPPVDCFYVSYLEVTVLGDPDDPRTDDIGGDLPLPGSGLHIVDVSVASGDISALVRDQAVAHNASE